MNERIQALLARAAHPGTPEEEARTAAVIAARQIQEAGLVCMPPHVPCPAKKPRRAPAKKRASAKKPASGGPRRAAPRRPATKRKATSKRSSRDHGVPVTGSQSAANKILNWHDGQRDPIYAVGSSWLAGKPVDAEYVSDALRNLKSLRDRYQLGPGDTRELERVIDYMETRLERSLGKFPMNARVRYSAKKGGGYQSLRGRQPVATFPTEREAQAHARRWWERGASRDPAYRETSRRVASRDGAKRSPGSVGARDQETMRVSSRQSAQILDMTYMLNRAGYANRSRRLAEGLYRQGVTPGELSFRIAAGELTGAGTGRDPAYRGTSPCGCGFSRRRR